MSIALLLEKAVRAATTTFVGKMAALALWLMTWLAATQFLAFHRASEAYDSLYPRLVSPPPRGVFYQGDLPARPTYWSFHVNISTLVDAAFLGFIFAGILCGIVAFIVVSFVNRNAQHD